MVRVRVRSRRGISVSFGVVGIVILFFGLLAFSYVAAIVGGAVIVVICGWWVVRAMLVRHGALLKPFRSERVNGNYDYSRQREERARRYAELLDNEKDTSGS